MSSTITTNLEDIDKGRGWGEPTMQQVWLETDVDEILCWLILASEKRSWEGLAFEAKVYYIALQQECRNRIHYLINTDK